MSQDASRAPGEPDLGRFDELAGRAMQTWQVPGLAIAIVHGDAAPVLRTFGVRDTATREPVDERTRFATCSLTKSFTAAGLLLLLEEHGLALTARVADLLPGFALSDPVVTGHLTVRDLLAHASGLPRHDRLWTPGDLSRPEMVARMRHLAFSGGLRERFQYNNLGYIVLACIAERLDGRTWEDFTTATLLRPLGFRDFGWLPDALAHEANHATPHCRERDTLHRGRHWPVPAPSGGLTASISDFAAWLRALLGADVPGVDPDRWKRARTQMTTPWMYAEAPSWPELEPWHYGLGLCCQHYRGRRMITHTGSMPGWGSLLAWLPQEQVGIVALTNRDANPVPQLLAFALFDAVCGLAPVDWYSRLAQARSKALADEAAGHERESARPEAVPLRPLGDYAGRYTEPAYGTVEVGLAPGGLTWSWRGLHGPMQALGADVFAMRETPPARHAQGLVATFRTDPSGRPDRLEIPHEPEVAPIAFRRGSSGNAQGEAAG